MLTPVDEVIELLMASAQCLAETELVPLQNALGRVLAEDLDAKINVPPQANSAMDGYAVYAADCISGEAYEVSDRIPAGSVGKPLVKGTLARIFTGAPMPEGADAVVIQEDTRLEDGPEDGPGSGAEDRKVVILETPKPGENVRRAGQDIDAGAVILEAGRRLRASDLGLIASVGIAGVPVYKPLKIAVLATGDELVDPPLPLAPGQIYNSNHYSLCALIQSLGMEPVDLGKVEDTLDATTLALSQAAKTADIIISTGGVSVGEEDHVKPAVEALGELSLWRLAIKPGKPLAFGQVEGVPIFGLPGNPVSSFVTFMIIARPYLLVSQGMKEASIPVIYGQADFEFKGGGRREYLRVRHESEDGVTHITRFGNQGSGVLSSVSWATGLAEVEIGQHIQPGDSIKVFLLPELA